MTSISISDVQSETKRNETKAKASTDSKRFHLFKNSIYFDFKIFENAILSQKEPYKFADPVSYYEKALNWSESKGEMKKDWLKTVQNWILNDYEKGKLVTPKKKIVHPNGFDASAYEERN